MTLLCQVCVWSFKARKWATVELDRSLFPGVRHDVLGATTFVEALALVKHIGEGTVLKVTGRT